MRDWIRLNPPDFSPEFPRRTGGTQALGTRLQQELQEVRALNKNSNRTLLLRRFHVRGFESFCQFVCDGLNLLRS